MNIHGTDNSRPVSDRPSQQPTRPYSPVKHPQGHTVVSTYSIIGRYKSNLSSLYQENAFDCFWTTKFVICICSKTQFGNNYCAVIASALPVHHRLHGAHQALLRRDPSALRLPSGVISLSGIQNF